MTTLVINGQKVKVSDNFTSLSPQEQERTVDEIARSMGAAKPAAVPATAVPVVASPSGRSPEQLAASLFPENATAATSTADPFAGLKGLSAPLNQDGAALAGEIGDRAREATIGPLEAKAKGIAQGVAFGGADELGAAMISPFVDETYGEVRDALRRGDNAATEVHPGAYYTGNVLGALVPGAMMAKGVAAARSLPAAVGRGMGWGAAGGASQGFLSGEGGLANRMTGAGIGAGIGATIGGAVPLIGAGVQRVARALSDGMRGSNVGASIGTDLGVSNKAGKVIGDMVSPDDPVAMRAAMDAAGPKAMLADASPTTGAMLDATLRSPTPGARVAGERITARAGSAGDEILDALSGGMQGPRQGVASTMDSIRTGTAGARSAAYDAAYAQPIDYASDAGAKLLDDVTPRIPGEAISYANRLMKLRGEKSGQIMASIADDGTVTFTNPPDVRQWDYIKQALDGLAESGDGAGALGGQTRMGSAYQGLAKEIRDGVASLVPEYRTALDTASDAITRRNAVKFGADLLSPKTTTEEALSEIATATGGQKAAMRDGLRGQVDEVIGNVKKVGSDQNRDARQALKAFTDLSSDNAARKMEALFGDEWPAIKKSLDEAGAALGLRARTAANSATNQRGVVQEAITDAVTPGAMARGRPIPALGDAWATLMNANPTAIKRMGRDVQSEIAELLTREGAGPAAVDAIVSALAKNPVNTAAGKSVRGVIEALLLGNTGQASVAVTERLGARAQ